MASTQGLKGASETSPSEIANQENVSAGSNAAKQMSSTKQQIRHRASVACASCRDRRIRCVVPKGEAECVQCQRTGTDCVIKNDDERRRPISKAYMASLSDRIQMLEGMLLDKGVVPPPPAHPPKTKQEAANSVNSSQSINEQSPAPKREPHIRSPMADVPSPPDSTNEDFAIPEVAQVDTVESTLPPPIHSQPTEVISSPGQTSTVRMFDPRQDDVVQRLLSTRGNLSFDQLSGRLRFFGPTANSHVYAESPDKHDSREPSEQVRRAERIIRSLTTETYDYLMNMFWRYYNGVLVVIDREAFEFDRESQNPKFYSSFLHITMLASGYRFADKDRDDILKISLGNRESTLHREAKHMLDIELERPGGITSVQALLLLGDLECGVGRDNTGWMYSGMANRLAFDIGLHLNCTNNSLSDRELSIRHMTMRACVVYDRYWALFLGRPTSIKNQDIEMDLLSKQFSNMLRANPCEFPHNELKESSTARELEVYDYLVELMELAGRIVEIRESNRISIREPSLFAVVEAEDNAYLQVINLDRQLQNWYRRLPDQLKWKPANIKMAPFSFFLLHQQYHVSMILLHRPWARYGSMSDDVSTHSSPSPAKSASTPEHNNDQKSSTRSSSLGLGDPTSITLDNRTLLSRSICTQQAIRVARIFWQHRQRFNGRKIFVTGIQHAGTAAIAIIAALAHQQNAAERYSYLGYLEVIAHAIHDMSETYHPAERMDTLLQAVIAQLKQDISEPFRTRNNSFAYSGTVTLQTGLSNVAGDWWRIDTPPSVLPARRGNADADDGQARKKPRPTPSRRASVFARPPAPFSKVNEHLTAPNSASSHSSATFDLNSSISSLFAGFSKPLSLDFSQDSAIDIDLSINGQHGLNNEHNSNSNNNHWSIRGLPSEQVLSSNPETAFQISDWISSGAVGGTDESSSSQDRESTKKPDDDVDMDWIGGKGETNGLSPISLSKLVQNAERTVGITTTKSDLPRNHELDFLSF